MRLTNRKTHFTERIPLLSIRSIRTDRHMAYTDRYGAGVLPEWVRWNHLACPGNPVLFPQVKVLFLAM